MFSSVDVIWSLVGAFLVFFMQAGFTLVESGFTRAKNAGNIIMKNLIDFCFGSVLYWMIGFGIMFGTQSAIFGGIHFFAANSMEFALPTPAYLFFQTVFCATAATIVSGAMAERTEFKAYCVYSAVISALIYPISGHWIWGGGFLAEMGFHDFAGSTAVHMVGGVAAFVGASILGPRIGKYTKEGKSLAIPGHNLTFAALGVFILWFCWFGFNGGSTTSMTGDETMILASNVLVNTNLAAACGTLAALAISWVKYKKPDVSLTLNGTLAGLVGVTAGCDLVSAGGAALIGLASGTLMLFAVEFIDQKLHVDDPVGAVAVHGVCGAFGTLATGLLATESGLLYGGGAAFLGTQAIGVVVTMAWVASTSLVLFSLIKATIGLRVSPETEIAGLDNVEHGLTSAYAGFEVAPETVVELALDNGETIQSVAVAEEPTITSPKSTTASNASPSGKLTNIAAIINESKLRLLQDSLYGIGVEGLTVTPVRGHGVQKGHPEMYRGAELPVELLPKVKVEVTVSRVPVDEVVNVMKKVLHTGNPGDGKIFIGAVENVIRISNSAEGDEALQGYDVP